MSKELIVSSGRHETRVAILEDDQVVELFHEREKEYSLAGSIHKGRVTRVLPGMQSAFVDIGLERDAFLYVSDFFEDNDEYDAVVSTVEDKVLKMEKGGGAADVNRPEVSREASRPPRQERVEPVVAEAAPAGRESAGVEVVAAPASGAPAQEHRHEGGGGRQEGGGRPDRGGRGRRGRRRRGGRGSGLPDSKFFTPGTEPAGAAAAEPDDAGNESEPESTEIRAVEIKAEEPRTYSSISRALQADDFMVLPGESLAKYSSDETADAPEPPAEPALPEEHPLAGFGSVASWLSPAVEEPGPAVEEPGSAEPPVAEVVESVEPLAEAAVAEVRADEAETNEGESYQAELDEPEADEAAASGVVEGEVSEGQVSESDAASLEASSEAPVDEGPEPARIPTSLTAALREQGHRYPHRVSRRMRRKMRGSPGEEGDKQPARNAPHAAEEKTVATQREDGRAPESRGGESRNEPREREPREPREPREARQQDSRGPRERSERPERERTERTERPERERPPLPSISDLLKEGQEIIVQIAKEPLGQKGARITSHIALPGRFVVYMPTVEHVGVSRKIPSDEERQRLKRILQTHRQGIPGGFICRTAAENKSEEELKSDMHFLYNLWLDMRQKAEKKPAPVLLHHDLDLVQRILRDQLTTSFKTIWVDNEELYTSILSFVERFQPLLVGRVKLYTRTNPIFDEFGITGEIEKALRPKVWLKSGGYIVINQTEALVAIDINTGKYVGKSNRLEDTIVKINTDAIKEIVRQIRLRDLGGIIVVDFIDMDERKNRQKVMMALEDSMRADRAPYKILQFNDFGLVAITRKRVKQSLERTLCSPCAYCEGAGYIKSVGTVVGEILQEAQKMRKSLEAEQSNLVLRVNPEVARILKSNHNSYLQEVEEILGKSVLVKSDPLLHQTKFDLA
jgi:ribonuclease G